MAALFVDGNIGGTEFMMTETELENIILERTYKLWLRHSGDIIFSLLEERPDIDQWQFERTAEKLEIAGYIERCGLGNDLRYHTPRNTGSRKAKPVPV